MGQHGKDEQSTADGLMPFGIMAGGTLALIGVTAWLLRGEVMQGWALPVLVCALVSAVVCGVMLAVAWSIHSGEAAEQREHERRRQRGREAVEHVDRTVDRLIDRERHTGRWAGRAGQLELKVRLEYGADGEAVFHVRNLGGMSDPTERQHGHPATLAVVIGEGERTGHLVPRDDLATREVRRALGLGLPVKAAPVFRTEAERAAMIGEDTGLLPVVEPPLH